MASICLIGAAGLWGIGRLPLPEIRRRITTTRDRLVSLVQIPELPQTELAPSAVNAVSGKPTLAVSTATRAAQISPTLAVTDTRLPVTHPSSTPSVATTTATPTSTASLEATYTVREGDTFSAIGDRLGIDWQVIADLNGLDQYSTLSVGQKLRLPTPTSPARTATPSPPTRPTNTPTQTPTSVPPTSTVAPSATATIAATVQAGPKAGGTRYRVQAGDSLLTIAARFGIDWQEIASANNITGSTVLQVGQELVIPVAGVQTGTTPQPARTPTPVPPTTVPAPVFPVPQVVLPEENKAYAGESTILAVQWQAVPGLPPDAQYQITIRWAENGIPQEYYWFTTALSTRVPTWLWLKADQPSRRYTWFVTAVQLATDGKGGERVIPLSPPSPTRTFYWN
jgi:LysM repeat protein